MKRLLILLALMGAGVWLLTQKDNKEINEHPHPNKKKFKKSHFPKKEVFAD